MMAMIYNSNNMNEFHNTVIQRTQTEQNAYRTIFFNIASKASKIHQY